MAQVVIAIPTMRAHRLRAVVQSIIESTEDYRILVIATGECANAARELPVDLIEDNGGTWAQRINAAFRESAEPYLMTAADDLAFRPGWFEAAMNEMRTVDGVVAVNDLHNMAGVHFLISRRYVDTLGGCIGEPGVVCHEGYRHAFVDDELRATAKFHSRWSFAREAVVEHLHPGAGKALTDETYRIGEESMSQGLALFQSRAHLWS